MFQRALGQVVGPEMSPNAFAYQNDIIVILGALQEHQRNQKEFFRRLKGANLMFLSKLARQKSDHSAGRGGVWTLVAGTGTLCITV